MANEARSAELAIIAYLTSAGEFFFSLKTPPNYGLLFHTLFCKTKKEIDAYNYWLL